MNRGYRRYKNPRVNPAGPVDLGLTDLVTGKSDTHEGDEDNDRGQTDLEKAGREPPPEKDPFEFLASGEKWGELASYCEEILSDPQRAKEHNIKAKLWWVTSQLKSGSVPSDMLAAPADTASRLLLEASADIEWSKKNLPLISMGSRMLTGFLDVLGNERFSKLGEEISERIKDFDFVVEEIRKKEVATEEEQKNPPVIKAEEAPPKADIPAAIVPKERKGSGAGLLFVILLMMMAAGMTVFLILKSVPDQADTGKEELAGTAKVKVREPEQIIPDAPLIKSVSHLEAIMYDMKGKQKVEQEGGHDPGGSSQAPVESSGNNSGGSTGGGKKIVDTSGPVEPEEVRVATTTGREDMKQPDNGQEEAVEESKPVFGDRLPLKGRGNEDFSRPRMYEIVSPTSVMSEPSIRSQVLGDLKSGDKILVEGRKGAWLKIRSRNSGEIGYLPTQDAMPEKGW